MKETYTISDLETSEIVSLINSENERITLEVERELKKITEAIDKAAEKFISGGRLIYVGAGTSGRLGYLDAIELEPTYGVTSDRALCVLAGGEEAMFHAVEGAEDSEDMAINDLGRCNLTETDIVIAISASGNTPYTAAAAKYARKKDALVVGLTCTEKNIISEYATVSININVGTEIILGSTRMKAGSAQKAVLNMISTGIMIKCGKVYKNFMVYVKPTNKKLKERAKGIISNILNVDLKTSGDLLKDAHNSIPIALIMKIQNCNYRHAVEFLEDNHGTIPIGMLEDISPKK